ncbi:MAG: hypothetical protein ACUVQY_05360 [Thermoproteota archaeon]
MQSSNRYLPLSLEANPFPLTPTPSRIWILGGESRIKALERIKEEIEYSFRLEEPKIDMLIGDAGSGKTHLALHLQYLLSQEKPGQSLSYLSTIQDSVYRPSPIFFTSKILEALGGERFLMELSLRLHQTIILKMDPNLFQKAVVTDFISLVLLRGPRKAVEIFNRISNDFRSVENLIGKGALDLNRLLEFELEELRKIFVTKFEPSKTRRFIDVNLAKWILWLPSHYYGSWGIKHINDYLKESDDNALKLLTTVVNLSKLVSNAPFIIVVDEVETLLGDNVESFFHTLKRIIDNGPGGLFLLLLLTPMMFEDLRGQKFRVAPAIVSRVSSTPISLEKISVEEARDIINRYVKALYLDKDSEEYSKIFPMNSVKLLWANSGGEIRRLLFECFTCIEILADRIDRGITEPKVVDTVIAMEAVMKMGPPRVEMVVPLEPDSDVKNQIITRFYNIEKQSERQILLEQALASLIEMALGRDNLLGRKRVSISLTKKREVDLLFMDSTSGGERVGVIIKAPMPSEGLKRSAVEPILDLTKSKSLDKLTLLTTSPADPDLQGILDSLRIKTCILGEPEISMIIYVSHVFKNLSRSTGLTQEESLEVLRRIGLIR